MLGHTVTEILMDCVNFVLVALNYSLIHFWKLKNYVTFTYIALILQSNPQLNPLKGIFSDNCKNLKLSISSDIQKCYLMTQTVLKELSNFPGATLSHFKCSLEMWPTGLASPSLNWPRHSSVWACFFSYSVTSSKKIICLNVSGKTKCSCPVSCSLWSHVYSA